MRATQRKLPPTRAACYNAGAMENREIARILAEIGVLLELKGENPFKVRAYGAAARQIEALGTPVKALADEKRLGEIPGVGEGLAEKIGTLVATGRLLHHEAFRNEDLATNITHPLFVIHDQDTGRFRHAWSSAAAADRSQTVKVAPCPGGLSTRTLPPCFSTML